MIALERHFQKTATPKLRPSLKVPVPSEVRIAFSHSLDASGSLQNLDEYSSSQVIPRCINRVRISFEHHEQLNLFEAKLVASPHIDVSAIFVNRLYTSSHTVPPSLSILNKKFLLLKRMAVVMSPMCFGCGSGL